MNKRVASRLFRPMPLYRLSVRHNSPDSIVIQNYYTLENHYRPNRPGLEEYIGSAYSAG